MAFVVSLHAAVYLVAVESLFFSQPAAYTPLLARCRGNCTMYVSPTYGMLPCINVG